MKEELMRRIYGDAIIDHSIARTTHGRIYAATKGLRLLEHNGYRGPEIDKLAQMVIDARAESD